MAPLLPSVASPVSHSPPKTSSPTFYGNCICQGPACPRPHPTLKPMSAAMASCWGSARSELDKLPGSIPDLCATDDPPHRSPVSSLAQRLGWAIHLIAPLPGLCCVYPAGRQPSVCPMVLVLAFLSWTYVPSLCSVQTRMFTGTRIFLQPG